MHHKPLKTLLSEVAQAADTSAKHCFKVIDVPMCMRYYLFKCYLLKNTNKKHFLVHVCVCMCAADAGGQRA